MKRAMVIGLLAASGCATAGEEAAGPGGDAAYRCEAEPIQDLVGRPATAELGADALRRSHSRTLRWIRPGDAVTMDYREDRLNVSLDAQGQVERLNCG